jgi:hypothetical protein
VNEKELWTTLHAVYPGVDFTSEAKPKPRKLKHIDEATGEEIPEVEDPLDKKTFVSFMHI